MQAGEWISFPQHSFDLPSTTITIKLDQAAPSSATLECRLGSAEGTVLASLTFSAGVMQATSVPVNTESIKKQDLVITCSQGALSIAQIELQREDA